MLSSDGKARSRANIGAATICGAAVLCDVTFSFFGSDHFFSTFPTERGYGSSKSERRAPSGTSRPHALWPWPGGRDNPNWSPALSTRRGAGSSRDECVLSLEERGLRLPPQPSPHPHTRCRLLLLLLLLLLLPPPLPAATGGGTRLRRAPAARPVSRPSKVLALTPLAPPSSA